MEAAAMRDNIEELEITPKGMAYNRRQFTHKKFPMVIHTFDNGMIKSMNIYQSAIKGRETSLILSVDTFVTLQDAEKLKELLAAAIDHLKHNNYNPKNRK